MDNLILGNCIDKLKELLDNSVDAVVTDPPYGLTSITKRCGKENSAPIKHGKDGSFARLTSGFMGQKWDGQGVEYNIDMWKEVLRVLKPGGHLLSFGGSRTYHRMACAIEDAGFEIRDMVEWVYGSGFPKSLNIGKQKGCQDFEGYGTALKPAHEPIVLARKPISEKTVALNVLKWGVGGLAIDNCRVGIGAKKWSEPKDGIFHSSEDNNAVLEDNSKGRFPANLIWSCPDDEYELKQDIIIEDNNKLSGWLNENAQHLL